LINGQRSYATWCLLLKLLWRWRLMQDVVGINVVCNIWCNYGFKIRDTMQRPPLRHLPTCKPSQIHWCHWPLKMPKCKRKQVLGHCQYIGGHKKWFYPSSCIVSHHHLCIGTFCMNKSQTINIHYWKDCGHKKQSHAHWCQGNKFHKPQPFIIYLEQKMHSN
jgi:hypothetical protein